MLPKDFIQELIRESISNEINLPISSDLIEEYKLVNQKLDLLISKINNRKIRKTLSDK